MKVLYLLLFLMTAPGLFSMSKKKENLLILTQKGYGEKNMQRLQPVIIELKKLIDGIVEINRPDAIGTLNENCQFSEIKILSEKDIKITPFLQGFPGRFGDRLKSDENFIWLQGGRGFYFLDYETKQKGWCLFSEDGNDEAQNSFLVDPQEKIFLIEGKQLYPVKGYFYVLYSLKEGKVVFNSEVFRGAFNPLSSKNLLFEDYKTGRVQDVVWYITDLYQKEKKEYKLTKEMTKLQMTVWPRTRTFCPKRKMMLGGSGIEINNMFYDYVIK